MGVLGVTADACVLGRWHPRPLPSFPAQLEAEAGDRLDRMNCSRLLGYPLRQHDGSCLTFP